MASVASDDDADGARQMPAGRSCGAGSPLHAGAGHASTICWAVGRWALPLGRGWVHRAVDELRELWLYHVAPRPPCLRRAGRRLGQAIAQQLPIVSMAGERHATGALEQHDTKGEDVGGHRRVRLEEITAEVACVALVVVVPCRERGSLPKVAQLVPAARVDEDVVGLDLRHAIGRLLNVRTRGARSTQRAQMAWVGFRNREELTSQ